MFDYRTAITGTQDAIHRRAALFRNQAIAVVALIGLTLLYSLIAGEWRTLLAIILLIPLCGGFFIADGRTVDRWRHQLLSGWSAKAIDFEAFRQAIRALPRLPQGTLEGMLETLPTVGDLTDEQSLHSSTRQAIAAACLASHHRQADALLLRVIASGIVTAVVLGAVWIANWRVLTGAVALVLLPFAASWLRRRRQAAFESTVAACRPLPDFDQAGYERVCARFH